MHESEVPHLCPTLCNPMDCSLPGSSVQGIFQAIVLEWIAISFSRGSPRPRDRTQVSRIVDRCYTVWATREVSVSMHNRGKLNLKVKLVTFILSLVNAFILLKMKPTLLSDLEFSRPGGSVYLGFTSLWCLTSLSVFTSMYLPYMVFLSII